ncbi:MAG: hypothetical protein C3F15_16030 [Holophagae bacterium]|nr:MAG: hypothetical protein C3F15_16030 [Holophagae bacterium]
MSRTKQDSEEKQATTSGCLARFYWMVVGNTALAFLAMAILEQKWWPPTWRDAAFWVVVASLAAVRFVDVRLLGGRTGEGTPATQAHLRRYLVMLVVVAAALWVLAHVVARAEWIR